jgi:hypothetical protein
MTVIRVSVCMLLPVIMTACVSASVIEPMQPNAYNECAISCRWSMGNCENDAKIACTHGYTLLWKTESPLLTNRRHYHGHMYIKCNEN